VVFNLFRQDCIRLVFPSGAKVKDSSGLLEGDGADRRRLAMFFGREGREFQREGVAGRDCRMARTIAEIAVPEYSEKPRSYCTTLRKTIMKQAI